MSASQKKSSTTGTAVVESNNSNPIGGKIVKTPSAGVSTAKASEHTEAPKKPTKTVKERPTTFVSCLDVILKEGGTWQEMIDAGNAAKAELEAKTPGLHIEFNGKPKLKSLVLYRTIKQQQKDYLGGKQMTAEGIF